MQDPTDYPVEYLVEKLYDELNGKLKDAKKVILERPEIKVQNKKTVVTNFSHLCYKLNRNTNDVKKYFESEMHIVSSINGTCGLVITGMFKEPQIMKVFSNYIRDFVKCKECNSCDTEIIKEDRIIYNNCNKCKSKKAF